MQMGVSVKYKISHILIGVHALADRWELVCLNKEVEMYEEDEEIYS